MFPPQAPPMILRAEITSIILHSYYKVRAHDTDMVLFQLVIIWGIEKADLKVIIYAHRGTVKKKKKSLLPSGAKAKHVI